MRTFTKILVFAVMLTYFLGFIIGGVMIFFYPEHLGEWLTYIGIPTATAIGFYCWKAKAENTIKIRNALYEEEAKRKKQLGERYEETKISIDDILDEIEEEQIL